MPRNLEQAIDIAEGRKNEGKEEPGEYKLTLADPEPDVYICNQIAAVWAALHRVGQHTVPYVRVRQPRQARRRGLEDLRVRALSSCSRYPAAISWQGNDA